MLHAASVPAVRWILIATALLGGTALIKVTAPNPTVHRLKLHAADKPGAFYLSAFRDGDIAIEFATADIAPLTITVTADITDGCHWMGTERLEPIDATTFLYDYSETILSCEPGATPTTKTPRTGLVTVED